MRERPSRYAVLKRLRARMQPWLLLLCAAAVRADLNWTFATVDNSVCANQVPSSSWYLDSDWQNKELSYSTANTRLNASTNYACQFCAYHEERTAESDMSPATQTRPMYGPCLHNEAPKRMACHQELRVSSVYGLLFFPDQRPFYEYFCAPGTGHCEPDNELLDLYANGTSRRAYRYPMHRLMRNSLGIEMTNLDSNGTVLSPAMYGISIENLMDQYTVPPDWEAWWIWVAQGLCDYGCHRNQSLKLRHVTAEQASEVDSSLYPEEQDIPVCEDCPVGHTSYWWPNKNYGYYHRYPKPYRTWPFTSQCWPFLGVIPVLKWDSNAETYIMDGTRFEKCPVNTYWRSCAHRRLYWAQDRGEVKSCTPCPDGWHTDGQTGRWYCTPPPGIIFVQPSLLGERLIARRDLIEEPQCVKCQAEGCESYNAADTYNAAENYNEEQIFRVITRTQLCEKGYYCPNPTEETNPMLPCPTSMPWSPPGSASIVNCTCDVGKYRVNQTCVPCTTRCPLGQSLVQARCAVGGTQDSVCEPCPNIPAHATACKAPDGTYFADFDQSGTTVAKCHYECNQGYYMLTTSGACQALDMLNATGWPHLLIFQGAPVFCPDLYTSSSLANKQDYYDVIHRVAIVFIKNRVETWRADSSLCPTTLQLCASLNGGAQWVPSGTWAWNAPLPCEACPPKPAGTRWTPTALQWSPTFGLSQACKYTCELPETYLQPPNDDSCANCSSYCGSTGQRAMGRGCGGNNDAQLTCVTCKLSAGHCSNTQWLHLGSTTPAAINTNGGCDCEDCAQLPEGYYWKLPCGGMSSGTQAAHTTWCPLENQFLAGENSATTTKTCQNCTTFRAGFYLPDDAACTSQQDAGWLPCPAGYYCAGPWDAAPTLCPTGMTSFAAAPTTEECFCALGTTPRGPSTCDIVVCNESVALNDRPGAVTRSPFFYELGDDLRTTRCEMCGGGAYTQGTKRGLASCTCGASGYVLNESRACVPCATQAQCAVTGQVPLPCEANTGLPGPPLCGCALPPFAVIRTVGSGECVSRCGTPCAAKCDDTLFQTAVATGDPPLRNVTGSGLYSVQPWAAIYVTSLNITAVHITSDKDEQAKGIQYVRWGTNGSSNLYVASTAGGGSPVHQSLLGRSDATIVAITSSRFKGDQLRDTRVIVAAVLQDAGGSVVCVTASTLDLNGAAEITTPLSAERHTTYTMQGAQFVHIQHVTYPQGGFCSIYNSEDQAYVLHENYFESAGTISGWAPNPTTVQLHDRGLPAGKVLAGVVQQRFADRILYLVMQANPSTVMSLAWTSSPAEMLFMQPLNYYSSPARLPWLSTFSSLDPLLVTVTDTGKPNVMDSTQMHFVGIEGFPSDSIVTHLFALSMQTANSTHMRAQMVAATANRLFSLPLHFCKMPTVGKRTYWNGTACVPIVCERKPQCTATQRSVQGQCVCNSGYRDAGKDCVQCEKDTYCTNGVQTACPNSLTTITLVSPYGTGRPAAQDCVCKQLPPAQYYHAPQGCVQCVSPYFCPDQWNQQLCPGGALVSVDGDARTNPIACSCAPGFTGVACAPCPANRVCPRSETARIYNTATVLMGSATGDGACVVQALNNAFQQARGTTNYEVWHSAVTRGDVTHGEGTLAVSILFQSTSRTVAQQLVDQLPAMAEEWFMARSTCQFVMKARSPATMSIVSMAANPPVTCGTGSTPSQDAISCVCAAGYATDVTQTCRACEANTFKAQSGPGSCDPCDQGKGSEAGSSACVTLVTKRSLGVKLQQSYYALLSLIVVLFTHESILMLHLAFFY